MKISTFYIFGLFLISFYSCKNDSAVEPVKLPEREVIEVQKFPSPSSFKAKGTPFHLVELPFSFDSISKPLAAESLVYNYGTVYLNYTNKLNNLVTSKGWENLSISEICKKVNPDEIKLKRAAGGFYNHTLFFEQISINKTQLSDKMKTAIIENFGSLENFKIAIQNKTDESFASQWLWVIVDKNKALQLVFTNNENNPLMQDEIVKGKPILAIDLWEHTYLNTGRNSKKDYVNAILNNLNWEIISNRYETILSQNNF